jgi:predicted AAA+ superfamily ATPase
VPGVSPSAPLAQVVKILRDVIERHALSNVVALRQLTRHLLGAAASPFSVHRFFNDQKSQGVAVSKDALHAMLGHLEDAFLMRLVPLLTSSERQRQSNPRKAYPVDPGLITAFDRSGKPNTGHALETAVLVELERRRCERSYVRTQDGFEVDFLATPITGRPVLIQVCADVSDAGAGHERRSGWQSLTDKQLTTFSPSRNIA